MGEVPVTCPEPPRMPSLIPSQPINKQIKFPGSATGAQADHSLLGPHHNRANSVYREGKGKEVLDY